MTKFTLLAAFGALALATPALGDGAELFNRCKACHALTATDGTEVVKGGKTGPNLGGIIGRPVASVADYKYGDSILAVGASGKVWDEAALAEYVADPVAWLKANGAGDDAKTKMSFKLAEGGAELAAYLATVK